MAEQQITTAADDNAAYCRRLAVEQGITAKHGRIGSEYATGLTYCACGASFITARGIRRHIEKGNRRG